MYNHSINKASTQKQKAQPALLFMLIALFLLTTCPIKKSINVLFFDQSGVETVGLNNGKTGFENGKQLAADSDLCSISDQVFDLPVTKKSCAIVTINLALLPTFSEPALLNKGPDRYLSKVFLYNTSTPVYIRIRRLLI